MSVRIPKYRLHKGSGQALVQINGERIYLGKHGTAQSREKYRRIVAKSLGCPQPSPHLPLQDNQIGERLSVSASLCLIASSCGKSSWSISRLPVNS